MNFFNIQLKQTKPSEAIHYLMELKFWQLLTILYETTIALLFLHFVKLKDLVKKAAF